MSLNISLQNFIQALPKTETHLHVEGALPYELLTAWRPEQYPPDPPFRRPDFRYGSFPEFERILLDHALPWFTTPERYHQAAQAIFAGHLAQNVRYVETSFHLPVSHFIGFPGPEILAAIRAAVPAGLEVRIFAGMPRNAYGGPLQTVIDDLENWDGLAGVDLHGFEAIPTEPWSATVWRRLRAGGKITKCHAGEFGGADRVREAILDLGVKRIQHGARAIEDPAVVALAFERGVTFDMCPISNVRLKVAPSLREHPLRRLQRGGIRCTLSTDDPLCFANRLNDEYAGLAVEAGFTAFELAQLARCGWEVADVEAGARNRAISEIERMAREV